MARDTILFDINETVLELNTLRGVFETVFGNGNAAQTWFSMLLHNSTVCVITGVRTSFAELAGVMLDAFAARNALEISQERRDEILATFARLNPYEDVRPALEKLRAANYRTVAFTNSSKQLVERQLSSAGIDNAFDEIISVEEIGSFKPDPRVYAYAGERLSRSPSELRLIACHDWDTHGALTSGLLAAHVDRSGAPYHPLYKKPKLSAKDLTELVDKILAEDSKEI